MMQSHWGQSSSTIQHQYHAMHEDQNAAAAAATSPSPTTQHNQQRNYTGGHPDRVVHHHRQDGDDEQSTDSSTQLWDQLNDEEARQVRQHESQFHPLPHDSRSNPFNIVVSMVLGIVTDVQYHLQTLARDFQRRREWEERSQISTNDVYFFGGRRRRRRRGQRQPSGSLNHPPPSAFAFDLQFGVDGLQPNSFHDNDNNRNRDEDGDDVESPMTKPLQGYPFVMLHDREVPNRQAIMNERETWGVVANLDVFLQHLYQYYYHRGLVPMTCKFFVEMFSLFFTLWLSRILLMKVDWKRLATCTDETTCRTNWSDYYYNGGSGGDDYGGGQHANFMVYWTVQGYTILILAYGAFATYLFWHNLQHAIHCRYILHDKLGLSERKLQGGALAWDTVVKALADHQQSGLFRTTLASTPLDPLSIAQRILRKENFLVAFFNQGLMDQCKIGNRYFWSSTIEWCVHNSVLNFIFNHKYEVRPAFVLDSASLQRRLQVCGVVHLLLLPFLILFVTLHFFLQNMYDFKASKQYMGNSQWSSAAIWQFREWNELPHQLEQRLEPSYDAASKYLRLFGTSEWVAATGKLLVFLGGATGGVLLVLGVLNDAILLHVQLWGRNLLWYAGMAGLVYSVGKALLPSKEATPSVTRNLFDDMDNALKNVSVYTHYYPESWKGRGWDSSVYKSFKVYFDTRVKLFLWELISLVLAPYILYFRLSTEASAICEFCLLSKARVQGVGDVCGFSTFDFDVFKDEAWDGRTLGQSVRTRGSSNSQGVLTETLEESVMRTGNLEEATKLHPKPRAREGKMEKSFFTFRAAHPSFKCPASGLKLMESVDEYRDASMAREQELHIEAAARQLELLARLERRTSLSSQLNRNATSTYSATRTHINQTGIVPAADAGAGSSHLGSQRSSSPTYTFDGISKRITSSQTGTVTRRLDEIAEKEELKVPLRSSSNLTSLNVSSNIEACLGYANSISGMPSDPLLLMAAGAHSSPDRLSTMSQSNLCAGPPAEQNADRQYYWLEKFHEHLRQEQDEHEESLSEAQHPPISLSGPIPFAVLPPLGQGSSDHDLNSDSSPS